MLFGSFAPALLAWAPIACHRWALQARGRDPAASLSADGLKLPLASLSSGISAAIDHAVQHEMKDFAAGATYDVRSLELDEEELQGRRTTLLGELGDIEAAGLVFREDGSPSPSTLGLALVMTARLASELDFPLIADLVEASNNGTNPAHANRASCALEAVVTSTLAEMEEAQLFTDASTSASISVNEGPQSMEEARSMHMRWAILELARARFAEDRPENWGSVGR